MTLNNEGFIRRSDLRLRAEYPHLKTRIFELTSNRYRIVFHRKLLNAAAISDQFADSIRIIIANVDLSNEVPSSYLRELKCVDASPKWMTLKKRRG